MSPLDVGLDVLHPGTEHVTAARRTDWVQPNFRDQYLTSRQLPMSMSGSSGAGVALPTPRGTTSA